MNEVTSEISLLDLLLVVVENLKLLIFGPVVIGLLAFAIAYALPKSFTSQTILALPASASASASAQAAAMLVSPLVLDNVIKSHNLMSGHTIEVARMTLASQIKVTTGKDGLLRLDVTSITPSQAQDIANALLDAWFKSTEPGKQDRADLEKKLAYAKTALASVSHLLDRLTTGGSTLLRKPLTVGDASTSLVAVGELQARYLMEVLSIPRLLQGLSRDVVVQPPTLPTEPVAPKKSLIAVFAALGSCVALLLWVFMCQAWRRAAQDPLVAEKQVKLRTAIGFNVVGCDQ